MYGFLNLGSKYRRRGNAGNIAQAMSKVCNAAQLLFLDRLGGYTTERAASYSQGVYNGANQIYLDGTCWAMVFDWARRFVLKKKMGYAHNKKYEDLPYPDNKMLHRGKYIAHVFGLPQSQNFPDVGAAIKTMDPAKKAETNHLLQQYYAEQKGSKKTVEEKFSGLSYQFHGALGGLGDIHIGNQQRINCIGALMATVDRWVHQSKNAFKRNQFSLFVHHIGFSMREEIGYQNWRIYNTRTPKQDAEDPLAGLAIRPWGPIPSGRVHQGGGHALAFAYDPIGNKCYFMDPNYGEWVIPHDSFRVANLIYDCLKTYTAGAERGFSNPLMMCRSIYHVQHGRFSSKSP
jgi:hypothetical protein